MSLPAKSFPRKLREGARPAFAAFAAVFLASALITFTRPKIYEATAELYVADYFPAYHEGPTVETTVIRSSYVDGENVKRIVESDHILRRIPPYLPEWLGEQLSSTQPEEYLRTLRASRTAKAGRLGQGLLTRISCRHRQPDVAAHLANAFATATRDNFIAQRQEEEKSALNYLEEALRRTQRAADATAAALAKPNLSDDVRSKFETELSYQHSRAEKIAQRLIEARAAVSPEQNQLRVALATPPAAGNYVSPNHLLDLSAGLLIGGIAAAATSHTLRLRRHKPTTASP